MLAMQASGTSRIVSADGRNWPVIPSARLRSLRLEVRPGLGPTQSSALRDAVETLSRGSPVGTDLILRVLGIGIERI
jgi:hypothetical protein